MPERLDWLSNKDDVVRYLYAQVLGNMAGAAYKQYLETHRQVDVDNLTRTAYDIAVESYELLTNVSNFPL